MTWKPIRKLAVALWAIAAAGLAAILPAAGAYDWDGLGPWGPLVGAVVVWGLAWLAKRSIHDPRTTPVEGPK